VNLSSVFYDFIDFILFLTKFAFFVKKWYTLINNWQKADAQLQHGGKKYEQHSKTFIKQRLPRNAANGSIN
jgi:hypothetical protein